MSQRNPMNERYNDENRKGKTRKSAASAKPSSTRAATVHTPPPKTKKQKKAEARERERKQEQQMRAATPDSMRVENLPEYKKLRRIWWGCLIGAIVLIVISFLSTRSEALSVLYIPCLVLGYALVIAAFYIDFGKIRKLRKAQQQQMAQGKSKEARAAQKAARAEARAQQKEAEEKFAEAKAAEEEKKESGLFARFRKKPQQDTDADTANQAGEGTDEKSK